MLRRRLLQRASQLTGKFTGALGEVAKRYGLAIRPARKPGEHLVEVALDPMPKKHKESSLRATYHVLALEGVESTVANSVRQFFESGRSLPFRN